jgi:hypothetical protein
MKKRLLFIDDLRMPKDCVTYMKHDVELYFEEWNIVRSYAEFTQWIIEHGLPDVISFDHDLGDITNDIELSGMDCAKWLVEYCMDNHLNLPKCIVHSQNPVGVANINGLVENFKKHQ